MLIHWSYETYCWNIPVFKLCDSITIFSNLTKEEILKHGLLYKRLLYIYISIIYYYISAFLASLFAKFVITLSKSSSLAMPDSMLNLVNTSSLRHCRPQIIFYKLNSLKDLSIDATVAGIIKYILKLIQTFGNNSHKPHGPQAGDYCFEAFCRNNVVSFSCMVSKSSDFWLCPLILNSHSIGACVSLRRKFNNQQNAQHTAAVAL